MGIFRVGFRFSVFSFQSEAVIEHCFSHLLATTIPWDIAGDARARRRRAKRFLMKSTAGVCVLCRLWAFRLRHGIFGYRGISGQMAPTRAVAGATACPPPRLRSTEVAEEGKMREDAAAQARLPSKYVCPLSYSLGIFRAERALTGGGGVGRFRLQSRGIGHQRRRPVGWKWPGFGGHRYGRHDNGINGFIRTFYANRHLRISFCGR